MSVQRAVRDLRAGDQVATVEQTSRKPVQKQVARVLLHPTLGNRVVYTDGTQDWYRAPTSRVTVAT